ncbi:PREDICTED: myomegalin-like [Chaetura pelagica]|uniref:myomegalin-like n=1 Tax=Chaetura pelagica TaxID=8897 RepID=UPI000523BAF3|nr:PREDICTED: myomegalin-like [Chaetura pelagica]
MAHGYRTLSQHLNDLKKENFSLKLRIYFLEERVQQKGEGSWDDVNRRNIELKVEVESLKRELQEKQQALDNTWVAAETQTTRSQAALQQQYEERQRESEHVYELLENKIQLLQEEASLARSEAEQATALARAEVERCRELAGKLKETARTKEEGRRDDSCGAMAQRRIEELTQELAASNRLVEALSAENHNLQQRLEKPLAVAGQVPFQLLKYPQQPVTVPGRMKDTCRICARELCGNQRRWIFHTAAKLNLQVLLSHVLGRELCRDGRSEFACSKCAFMLDRIYRFDTVIARIEALSIERLQKLLLEKDRLKFCIASMYRRNNEDPSTDDRAGDGTVDLSNLPDVRYAALLQEAFAYSGYEYWADQEEQGWEPHSCHAAEGTSSRPRRCRGCAALRVADADYEAICKVPRKVARSISRGLSSRWATSMGNEEGSACDAAESAGARGPVDGESMEEGTTPVSSVESLDTTVEVSPPQQKDEDAEKGVKGLGRCDDFSDDRMTPISSLSGNRLELALSLIKALDYKPLQSPRGSRLPIPVKSSLPPPKLSRELADGSASVCAASAFLNTDRKSFSRAPLSLSLDVSELQELWDDLCEDYMPLRVQNLQDEDQQPAPGDPAAREHVSDLCAAELQGKLQQFEAANKLLQEKLNELNFELKSVQETSQRQDHTIQSLNEALKSKESKTEELYRIIEGQNETMAKLRDMLQKSHLGQLQVSENTLPSQEQQMSLLDLQNTLFCTKLEVQKLRRAQRQKDHQLAEARRATEHLETMVHEEQQQKEATWKHNQELHAVVQQLQAELQDKAQKLQTVEWEKCRELQAQEQRVQRLTQLLARKEQLLQESRELLQCQQNLDKSPAAMNAMLEKLQQRVSDRDAALERAVDEKFCALEKKEQELQQLHLSIREHGGDLERLRNVLSSNEATIHSLESLLKAKTLELEQVSATCQNLRWLKEEIEAKSCSRQKEQEGIIQQLQTCLHDRNKEVEELTATLLCKLGPGQSEVAEELCLRLQHKEKMLQDLLSDRNCQTMEHDAEIRALLQAVSTKEQQSRVAVEKMSRALAERSCELQLLRQHLLGKEPVGTQSAGARLLKQDKQPIQEILQRACGDTAIARPQQADSSCRTGGVTTSAAELEKDLLNAKEELELMAKKERESRRELAALQSVVATQEEELQVQASDIESLTRTIQMKEDLIKDLQMQLVDPEEIPAMERLTEEVLVLREKVAIAESRGQEATGSRKQQLLLVLEGLVAERNRLNEALQAERQLYGSLVKFHTHPDSSARDHTLQVELEGVQELRGQLEEALGRSLERLSRLETQGDIGGQATGADADASTNFTSSIKKEAAHGVATQLAEGTVPGRGWPGLGAELCSQVVQGQRQCQELQDKLAASEAVVRAQAEQLEKYHVLLPGEPHAQQLSKQVQVDFQDLGYETCGRSETEADRDETTSPECEEPDVFSELSLGEELGSPYRSGTRRAGKAAQKAVAPADVGVLHQHIQDLKAQLLNANKVIQSLQRRARSISVTSGYTSGAERPQPGPTALASPAHSLTDEDEGWQSDGHGTLCPPALRTHRDLQHLVHRVALLEAQLPAIKPGGVLPKELQSATWPGKYDSLIQAQARELSHLRQTLREGRGVSHSLAQHLRDALRSFEDLLRGTDIDYYLGQGFREQLARGRQLADRLSDKLGTRDQQDGEDRTSHELLALRLSRELQEKEKVIESLEAKLQERCESPGSSRPPSESSRSATSTSFVSEGLEPCSDGDVASECSQCPEEPAHLTGLHFDSLSKPVSAPLPALAPELPPFLPAGPPPPSAAPLLGCCGTPVCSLAEAQQELQVLRRQLGESVRLPVAPAKPTAPLGPFREGSKAPVSLCQHGMLQSLAEIPGATETRALWDQPPPSQLLSGALPSGYPSSQKLTGADLLEEHLVEIRSLRQRLEESICTKDRLAQQKGSRCFPSPPVRDVGTSSAVPLLSPLPSDTPVARQMDVPGGADAPVRKSEGPTGAHVISRLDTYRALEQRVLEGKVLARELMCLTRPALGLPHCPLPGKEALGWAGAGHLWGSASSLHRVLEECVSLLAAFWSTVLPASPAQQRGKALGWAGAGHLWGSASSLHRVLEECVSLLAAFWSTVLPASPAQQRGKEQELQGEIVALRAQLSEREDALQSTAERLRSTARLKDSMEQFIVSQLTRTHNVLRKARTNLEVKTQQVLPVA